MTVADNIGFGLKVRHGSSRPPAQEIRRRASELLDLVQLSGLEKRYPAQLSGGQRQRVALARAMAIEPKVLLLDEPFGALDAQVRRELRRWLREIHDRTGHTTVFVTHDQEEALEVADRVVVMDKGRIQQIGTPEEVYERPATAFVHEFIGESIALPVVVDNGAVRFDGHAIGLEARSVRSGKARLFIRPSDMTIVPQDDALLSGIVKRVHGLGPARRAEVALGESGTAVEIDASRAEGLDPGQPIGLTPARYRIFAAAD